VKVHDDWDSEKATQHIEHLEREAEKEGDIHERLSNLADLAWEHKQRIEAQVEYCRQMFSKPREYPSLADLRLHQKVAK